MNQPELWTLSLQAFAAVIVVLGLLAAAVRLLTAVFRAAEPAAVPAAADAVPAPAAGPGATPDPFVLAAVQAAARQVAPDAVIVRVDEISEGPP